MSSLTAVSRVSVSRPAYRATGLRVLRAEWAKFWSLRSSWITLAVAVFLLLVVGVVAAGHYTPQTASSSEQHHLISVGSNAVAISLSGLSLAQLAVGVLGVLFAAGEYSTGMIRSTLAAVPRRFPVLWSKMAVFGAVTLAVMTAAAFISFLLGEHLLSGQNIALTLSSSGVVRSLLGAGVFLTLVGVLGVALGFLVRSVAGGIALLIGLMTLLPVLLNVLPSSLADNISPYLPGNAGDSIFALTHDSTSLSPGAGLAVFAGWTALAVILAAYRLLRKDA